MGWSDWVCFELPALGLLFSDVPHLHVKDLLEIFPELLIIVVLFALIDHLEFVYLLNLSVALFLFQMFYLFKYIFWLSRMNLLNFLINLLELFLYMLELHLWLFFRNNLSFNIASFHFEVRKNFSFFLLQLSKLLHLVFNVVGKNEGRMEFNLGFGDVGLLILVKHQVVYTICAFYLFVN